MKTTVQRWGNSLAPRIPEAISEALDIGYDTEVEILVKDGCLVLSLKKAEYSLKEMLAEVTAENIHHETGTGERLGGEVR